MEKFYRVHKRHTLMITTEHEKNVLLLHKLNSTVKATYCFSSYHRVDIDVHNDEYRRRAYIY